MSREEIQAEYRKEHKVPPVLVVPDDPPESDLPTNFPLFSRPAGLPATCSDAMLCEAVKAYLLGTDEKTLGRMLGVPTKSVRYWTDSKEWAALVDLHAPELKQMLKGQLTRVASMTLRQLEDRLTYGDQVFDQKGEFVRRREVKGRDLAEIATRVLEQRANLEKLIGDLRDDKDSISLQKLAQGLKRYAEAKDISGEASLDPA
jgi:hypothetical protein